MPLPNNETRFPQIYPPAYERSVQLWLWHQQDTDSHQESQQIRNEFPLIPRPDQLQNQTPLLSQALFPESF